MSASLYSLSGMPAESLEKEQLHGTVLTPLADESSDCLASTLACPSAPWSQATPLVGQRAEAVGTLVLLLHYLPEEPSPAGCGLLLLASC